MSDLLKLCIIGAGRHASWNVYPSFQFLKDAYVAANCDLDLERARTVARKFGIEHSYDDYRLMLEEQRPDGVLIVIGPDHHAKLGMELMRLGYHVYTEKPPAMSYAQAKQVVAVMKETGKICMTGMKKRFAPAYRKAKAILDDPAYGKPEIMSFIRTTGNYTATDDPLTQYLLESAVHPIDLCNYFFGKVESVYAVKKEPSTYSVSLQFRNGAVGNMTLTDRVNGPRKTELVTLITSDSTIVEIDNSVEMTAFKDGVPFAAHKPDFSTGGSHSTVEQGFAGELNEFVAAIREGRLPVSNVEETAHSSQLYEAIKLSSETKQVVFLED
ncbi:Gfo/Idh/MocA family oxidoreductase [Paenibacillus sp.]|uniref:Gfo/Idh/MocA family protein n=1 Tax=Paenibacillus sp. TaxID=58172 RepID=UPI002D699B23|nr:Gfo/Idh/MocA family oxidoreductase [Paenibacillus sp.]HZG55927.1 Gfo/Idh/MocA family oxidoreductase [Paenibacillus sp.]